MIRPFVIAALAALAALAAGCTPTMHAQVDEHRILLSWEAIPVPPDATDVRYEVEIHAAEQGLPVSHVRSVTVRETTECDPGHLTAGDYVWSVRARYRRLEREWVTRWQTLPTARAVAVVPERGFCPLTVPE